MKLPEIGAGLQALLASLAYCTFAQPLSRFGTVVVGA